MVKTFFRRLQSKLFIMSIIFLLVGVFHGCKDPYDYEPAEDTLQSPPDPPILTFPADSAWYILDLGELCFITFQWDTIYDADMYEFEFDTSWSFGKTAWAQLTSENTITFAFLPSIYDTVAYHWHVRAASDLWVWWTNWSEVRTFIIPQVFLLGRH
jgi:hypothetical protein